MRHEFILVCASQSKISYELKSEIRGTFNNFNLITSQEIERDSVFSHDFLIYFSCDPFETEKIEIFLKKINAKYHIDTAIIPKDIFHSKKKLVVFDMDSTLITAEVIDEMAQSHGVGEKVKLITSRAMNGELNFDESLRERVALLHGFNQNQMNEIISGLKFTTGTPELCRELKSRGVKMAIASGGFHQFAEHVQKQLQIDYLFANNLEIQNNILTGKTIGPIVNAEKKSQIIDELGKIEKISTHEIVAIGDGANDIPMLLKAGLGIAVHAKEKVQQAAHYRINYGPMTHVLSFMNHENL
jgi:phosphoserine phosphatase